ncbi:MAG: NUDIX hydrolase [Chloroflexi bacterium]|nr:NUDIX hydrolase [Chloroflexota bacterium]
MQPTPVNFCQVCGAAMIDANRFGKLRRTCPACGYIHFDDPKVAAVVFIERDGAVLLVQRAVDPERGKWALPAGYIDYGEHPAEAAIREVHEETGLEIAISGLLAVQGGAAEIGASIVIIYAGRVVNGVAQPLDDADAIGWFKKGDPLPDIAFESTHAMLDAWRAGRLTPVPPLR